MSVTDILDDLGGPNLIEMTPEPPPAGHALQISTEDLTKLSAIHFAPIVARRCEVRTGPRCACVGRWTRWPSGSWTAA